jgi:hypothetical protein
MAQNALFFMKNGEKGAFCGVFFARMGEKTTEKKRRNKG